MKKNMESNKRRWWIDSQTLDNNYAIQQTALVSYFSDIAIATRVYIHLIRLISYLPFRLNNNFNCIEVFASVDSIAP